jgi:hypothetical protein
MKVVMNFMHEEDINKCYLDGYCELPVAVMPELIRHERHYF